MVTCWLTALCLLLLNGHFSVLSDTGSGVEVFFVANDLFMVTHHAGQQSVVPVPFNHSFRVKVR
jgi:hypothetical protein